MKGSKPVSRICFLPGDTLFFYQLSMYVSAHWVQQLEQISGMKSFHEAPGAYDKRRDRNLIIGSDHHWRSLVYPQLDQNPLIVSIVKPPLDVVLEHYWMTACGITDCCHIHPVEAQIHGMTIEMFLEDPACVDMWENPQWSALLKLNDVWLPGLEERISLEAQWKLICERIQQMAFIGLEDELEMSTDLCSFTFQHAFQPPAQEPGNPLGIHQQAVRSEVLSRPVMEKIQQKNELDQKLYQFTKKIVRDRFIAMAEELEQELRSVRQEGVGMRFLPVSTAAGYTQADMAVSEGVRRLRQWMLPAGSRRESTARKIFHLLQDRKNTGRSINGFDPMYLQYGPERWASDSASGTGGPPAGLSVRFTILVLSKSADPEEIGDTLRSISSQGYPLCESWLLPGEPGFSIRVPEGEQDVRHFKGVLPGGLSLHQIVEKAAGDYLLILQAGDRLRADALAILARELSENLSGVPIDMIYFDEVRFNQEEEPEPWLKPGKFSPEVLLSVDYLQHACISRHLLYGEWAESLFMEAEGAVRELDFRCVEGSLGVIRHLAQALVRSRSECQVQPGRNPSRNDILPVTQFLGRSGMKDAAVQVTGDGALQLNWALQSAPGVSIIIPSRNQYAVIKACVDAIHACTDYPDFEVIIVDSGSHDPRVRYFYTGLVRSGKARISHLQGEFNYSAANNLGAAHAEGDLLLFLNNDTKPLERDWLTELVRWLEVPGVGGVGAKLLYPDGTIQYSGTVLGMNGVAGHQFAGLPENANTLFGSAMWYRNVSALTGACMLVPRRIFLEAGRFNEGYRLAFSDVDLSHQIIKRGYRLVLTPFSRVMHKEGRSREAYVPVEDIKLALHRIGAAIGHKDPYYHPALSLVSSIPEFRSGKELSPLEIIARVLMKQSEELT